MLKGGLFRGISCGFELCFGNACDYVDYFSDVNSSLTLNGYSYCFGAKGSFSKFVCLSCIIGADFSSSLLTSFLMGFCAEY